MKKSLKELSADIYALEQKKELTAEEQDQQEFKSNDNLWKQLLDW